MFLSLFYLSAPVLAQPNVQAAKNSFTTVHQLIRKVWISLTGYGEQIDAGAVAIEIKRYQSQDLAHLAAIKDVPRTTAQKIALLEVLCGRVAPRPADFAVSLGQASRRVQGFAALKLEEIDFDKGVTGRQIDRVIASLYATSHGSPVAFSNYFKQSRQSRLQETFLKLAEIELGSKGVKAFIADSGKLLQSRWDFLELPVTQWLATAVLDSFVLAGAPPFYWPKFKWIQNKMKNAVRDGALIPWQEVASKLTWPLERYTAYTIFRKAYYRILIPYLLILGQFDLQEVNEIDIRRVQNFTRQYFQEFRLNPVAKCEEQLAPPLDSTKNME